MTQPREERIETTGGLNLFARSWRPETEPRGVVVIVPGFNAHSGYYGWVAQRLTSDGLAVYSIDLRGRGKSDGERFYFAFQIPAPDFALAVFKGLAFVAPHAH